MPRALVPALLLVLLAAFRPASGQGELGLALKSGEGGGAIGAQLAWNVSSHWQAALGVGGAGVPYIIDVGSERTDSYYLLGKYYLKHLYFTAGYSLKHSRVYANVSENVYRESAASHGIPLHLGYEFGNREGFFFAASAGYLYVFRNGGERVMGPGEESWSDARTADSGPSLGFILGYYFDVFGP